MPQEDIPETKAGYRGPDRRKGASNVTIDESWNKFFAKVGVGGIAAFLVYQMTINMQQTIQTTASALTTHVAQTDRAIQQTDQVLRMLLNVPDRSARIFLEPASLATNS